MIWLSIGLASSVLLNLYVVFRLGRVTMMRDQWEAVAGQWQEVAINKEANDAALNIVMKQRARGDA